MKLINRVLKKLKSIKRNYIFKKFIDSILAETWKQTQNILDNEDIILSEEVLQKKINLSDDPIVKLGYKLRTKVLEEFKNKFSFLVGIRILIHMPSTRVSPGGYSMFQNLLESLEYIGIAVKKVEVGTSMEESFSQFNPTVFLSSDNYYFTSDIDWDFIQQYKKKYLLKIGLTASIEEYGNSPLKRRLREAKDNGVDFFYSFRAKEYLQERASYQPYFNEGFNIFSIEFGANPLLYYPIPSDKKDLNYIFLASSNPSKIIRYNKYLKNIFTEYSGFICGTGWHYVDRWPALAMNKFLFSRAKIGINIHLQDQVDWANELNERTYILAACGIVQLVDEPKILPLRFSNKAFFVARNGAEYGDLFKYILDNPLEVQKRTKQALLEVYDKHTTFHRAENFILELKSTYKF